MYFTGTQNNLLKALCDTVMNIFFQNTNKYVCYQGLRKH